MYNEYGFLYCCLNNNEALKEVPHLDSVVFFDPIASQIFSIIKELIKKGFTPNINTIKNYLDEESFTVFISNITENINITDYAIYLDSIKNTYSYDRLEKAGAILHSGIMNKVSPMAIANSIQEQLKQVYFIKSIGNIKSSKQLIEEITQEFAGDLPSHYLGIPELDQITGPVEVSNMIVIAGRPSMGKTAALIQILVNQAIYGGQPCVLISLEMGAKALMKRVIANVAGISLTSIRLKKLTERQAEIFDSVREQIETSPLHILDNVYTIAGFEANLELLKNQYPELTWVGVDYIQLMENTNEGIANMLKEIKRIGKKLELRWILASQLSRLVESREDKRPLLSDLRDSGAIEQDADIIIFPFREAYYDKAKKTAEGSKSATELIVAKNRDGDTGTAHVIFDKNIQRFSGYKSKTP